LAEYNTRKEVDIVDDQLKIKALIEYKSLCLLNKQKALRQELVSRRASMPSEPEIRAANNEAALWYKGLVQWFDFRRKPQAKIV
jgi:hypothetical protein